MVSNLNDILRKQIHSMDVLDFIEYFRNLNIDNQEKILRLLLIDYYKVNIHDRNKLKISNENIDSILMSCLDNSKILYEIVEISRRFYLIDYFSKSLLVEEMEVCNKDRVLLSIFKGHMLDKITYKIVDDIELYKEYYKVYMEFNNDNILGKKLIVDYFCFRLSDLRYNDEIKYKKYILEFIKVYYKWKKFIKEHEGMYLLNMEDFLYLEKIENEEIDKLYNTIYKNFEFLRTIVGEYLHYSTEKLEIKENIIDEFIKNNTSENVKNKLRIK